MRVIGVGKVRVQPKSVALPRQKKATAFGRG
jgi:hypothetical protein